MDYFEGMIVYSTIFFGTVIAGKVVDGTGVLNRIDDLIPPYQRSHSEEIPFDLGQAVLERRDEIFGGGDGGFVFGSKRDYLRRT